ncbi:MAG: hypothetical protein CMJ78_24085 [Planctomycetaceae bacterium]|nr:hypothetical protein [Planctomycetaceae bacterium]
MEPILLELLRALKAIGDAHEELYDTEVRECIGIAIMEGFVRAKPDYLVPVDLGLADTAANGCVREAITNYITVANAIAAEMQITTFHDRLAAFQNGLVRVNQGRDYEDFFGHTPPEWYDTDGNVMWERGR